MAILMAAMAVGVVWCLLLIAATHLMGENKDFLKPGYSSRYFYDGPGGRGFMPTIMLFLFFLGPFFFIGPLLVDLVMLGLWIILPIWCTVWLARSIDPAMQKGHAD